MSVENRNGKIKYPFNPNKNNHRPSLDLSAREERATGMLTGIVSASVTYLTFKLAGKLLPIKGHYLLTPSFPLLCPIALNYKVYVILANPLSHVHKTVNNHLLGAPMKSVF
jgi:hypothetical protein